MNLKQLLINKIKTGREPSEQQPPNISTQKQPSPNHLETIKINQKTKRPTITPKINIRSEHVFKDGYKAGFIAGRKHQHQVHYKNQEKELRDIYDTLIEIPKIKTQLLSTVCKDVEKLVFDLSMEVLLDFNQILQKTHVGDQARDVQIKVQIPNSIYEKFKAQSHSRIAHYEPSLTQTGYSLRSIIDNKIYDHSAKINKKINNLLESLS